MHTTEIIQLRRSIDPDLYNGEIVDKNIIQEMLEAANWAPTHGYTEPWRFIVFEQAQIPAFGNWHALLYKEETPPEHFLDKKFEKLKNRAQHCSHIIVCVNKRGTKNNIPEIEEIAATSAAIQNLLLVATAHQVATFWSTGGMCYHPKFKEQLGFEANDSVLGIIYVGKHKGEIPKGKRTSDWESKVSWK